MSERLYLKKTIVLGTRSGENREERTFHIKKKMSEGASCVCYEAYHDASARGVLKEFYPQDVAGLTRDESGRLVFASGFAEARFRDREKAYLETYEILLRAKQDSETQELATFIPDFELYDSGDGDAPGTAYVFTPRPKLETFDKICAEIHKHPAREPERKLVTVLTAVTTLAKCVCALHCAGLVHRDIKPSNFGFVKRGGETLTQTLSLFDIDSICSVYEKTEGVTGTEGYMEPEAGLEAYPANNQTDIYAIGATLYHAIIVSDEAKENGWLYRPEQFDRLQELVDSSRLIQASEANAHPRLRHILGTILQNCLCERTYRYASCEELLEDLYKALYYALPSEIAKKAEGGQKWVLADAEKYMDREKEKNSSLAIQYHLYRVPLYRSLCAEASDIRVMVVGFGNYGQKFLDACLQVGQMRGKTLDVTVVSDERADLEQYLGERPALGEFFNVEGSLDGDPEAYGNLSFVEISRLRTDSGADLDGEILVRMQTQLSRVRPDYIFIALGEDGLNLAVARACEGNASGCTVCYVSENEGRTRAKNAFPVFVNADAGASPLYRKIERMAFNTHLVWEKNLNVDFRSVRAEFRKKYNHDACVANVLSLKYKLYSVGIDLDEAGEEKAAELFARTVLKKKEDRLYDELVWAEHRRWVTEKLCLGWRKKESLRDCLGGMTKDARRKEHICIVRSRPDRKLAEEWSANDYKLWDTAKKDMLDQLDGLDRMSVSLHRVLEKEAKKQRRENMLSENAMIMNIRELTEPNKTALVAFQEWYTCLKDIWNKDISATRLYRGLKERLLKAAECLPAENRRSVGAYVRAFETKFYPILASMEYRDWKQDDLALVENIPFILTYTEHSYLAVPFLAGAHSEVFENVSALSVVNPERVLYLYLVEKKQDLQDLQSALARVLSYLRKKQLRSVPELVLVYPKSASDCVTQRWLDQLKRLEDCRIRQVKCIRTESLEDISDAVSGYLARRSAGKEFFAVAQNTSGLSRLLTGGNVYRNFQSYRFDSATMKFYSLNGCSMLRHIRKRPFLRVTEMAAFAEAFSVSSNEPEFYDDYEELWEKYQSDPRLWKSFCAKLGEHVNHSGDLVYLKKKEKTKDMRAENYVYILPFACIQGVKKIIDYLRAEGIVEQNSIVRGYTTDSCKIMIWDKLENRKLYDRLFSDVYALMDADALQVYTTKDHVVHVAFDRLVVSGAALPEDRFEKCFRLLEYFQEKGYVLSLKRTPENTVSFTFATRKIKELLTTAGKMLEVYTYHKAKATGAFDDVVSSFEIIREQDCVQVKNEFDCILTKGFRSLFVECKARPELEQGFYYKLSVLEQQFGVNATGVLVADTKEEASRAVAQVNEMQRMRGSSMMHIVTIYKEEDIRNIGETLLKILSEN